METENYMSQACRCCCKPHNDLLEMRDVTCESESQKSLIDCFTSVTGLCSDDILYNTKICGKCHDELLSAFKFRENAILTHLRYLNQIETKPDPEIIDSSTTQISLDEPLIKVETFCEEYLEEEFITTAQLVSEKVRFPNKIKTRKKVKREKFEGRLMCDHCPKTFDTKRYLTNHLLRKHFNSMKSHLCDNCGLKFLGISELKNHIRTTHTTELPYACQICPRSYRSLQSLKVHLTSHSDVRAFVCEECSASFKTGGALFNHRRLHKITNDPFICEICSSKFTTKLYYEKHLRSHSIEQSVKCPQCEKCFKNQVIFKLHQRTHTGEMYKCNSCPKEYNTKEKLSKHFLCTHSGQEKQFKCHLCSSAFFVNHKLNRHLRNVHKVEITIDKRKIKKY